MQPDHSKTKNLHVTGPTFIRYSFIGFRICRCLFKRLLQQGICRAQWKDRGNLSVVPEELLLLEEEEESESEESDWLEEPEEESDEPEEESEDSTSWFCVMIDHFWSILQMFPQFIPEKQHISLEPCQCQLMSG